MTFYLAERALRPGEEVVAAPYDAGRFESVAGLEPDDSLTARDLFYGLLVASGNDAAATLALAVAGSEATFVGRMNAAARKMGLRETTYADPIGLDPGNVSSVRDLVDLTLTLRSGALFRRIVDTPRITLRSGAKPLRLVTTNSLVLEESFVDGVKTGTTLEAGYVLVASARKQGVELVSAVTGAFGEDARDAATLRLLEYGFSLYRQRALVERGERIAAVRLATGGGRLPLEASQAVEAVAREDQRVKVSFDAPEAVAGPIALGETFGEAIVKLDGREVGRVDALASRAVAEPAQAAGESSGLPGWAVITLAGAGLVAFVLAGAAIAVARRSPR